MNPLSGLQIQHHYAHSAIFPNGIHIGTVARYDMDYHYQALVSQRSTDIFLQREKVLVCFSSSCVQRAYSWQLCSCAFAQMPCLQSYDCLFDASGLQRIHRVLSLRKGSTLSTWIPVCAKPAPPATVHSTVVVAPVVADVHETDMPSSTLHILLSRILTWLPRRH